MARKAKASDSGFKAVLSKMDIKAIGPWASDHREELQVAGVAALIAFFFTQGLPLWDDDYSQWLAQANGHFFELLKRMILPFTSEPQTWGYSDRPGQAMIYWVLSLVFGTWGAGYFFVKSLVFGGLCASLYHWMRKLHVGKISAYLALTLFALSTNIVSALVVHSDFGVYAEWILVAVLFYAVEFVDKGPANINVFKKGFDKLPKPFTQFLIIFFVAVYFGTKVRGEVRLAPVIMLTYLYFFKNEKFKVYAAPFGFTFLATLPWSGAMFSKLPPFVPGAAAYEGWTYGSFSVARVFQFLASDIFSVRGASISVLGATGALVILGGLAYAGFRVYQERFEAPSEKVSFFLVWMGVAALACGLLRNSTDAMQLRYTLLLLVPSVFVTGHVLQSAFDEFGKKLPWFKYAVYGLVALQCVLHLTHDVQQRKLYGHGTVAVNEIYRVMDEKYPNASLVYFPGFPASGYKASSSPALTNRKALGNQNELSNYPVGNTYAITAQSLLDANFSVAHHAKGCGVSLFDAVFRCDGSDGVVLLKYVGTPPEMTQANQFDKQGNLVGARDALQTAYNRDKGNHGVAFSLSLYKYRLADFVGMEEIYDQMGPFFLSHGSVLYNWGLAKQGLQKYKEAAVYFERALALWPNDYGIGFNLADAYFRSGKKRRAIAAIDEMIRSYPNDQPMKNARAEWSK